MSRLIIKNLPKNINEQKIRSLFEQKGTITDIQLKYTSDGKFRQFGFIGYKTEEEAQKAVAELNNIFINTNKITVEACALLGDSAKPKAWSKYASDSSAFKKIHKTDEPEPEKDDKKKKKKKKRKDESEELLEKYKDDSLFEEFLNLHAPEESKKLKELALKSSLEPVVDDKTNDDSAIESDNDENEQEEIEKTQKIANEAISDLEYMKQLIKGKDSSKPREKTPKQVKNLTLFTLKLRDLPYNCKKKEIKHFFKPLTPFTIRIPAKIHGIAYVGFKTEKDLNKALLKDRSFIAGKQIQVMKYDQQNKPSEVSNDSIKKPKWISQEETLKNEENIAESGKIFIRNLSYTTNEADIEELFKKFGPITEVNLPIDKTTKKLKGFGTIIFLMPEHAAKAYSELDGSVFHGRMLHLLPGKNNDNEDAETGAGTNFKLKKAKQQKSTAGSSHNWNSLFLGHDAVAEVIADTYSTTKETVLGPHAAGSAAVRLALGETQIVAQTRKYLEQEGVVLDAFNDANAKRSKTIILVKNLPHRTDVKEISDLFIKFGGINRVVLPPSGITAIVEFLEPSEARKAFTGLAYSKFKNVPLYLEWAPETVLVERKGRVETCVTTKVVVEKEKVEEVEEEEPEPDTTLFVKNLNFKTTDEGFRKHFERCGKIFYANVATKKDASNPGEKLSMGYGFVRFLYKAGADKALKTMQQSVLDDKALELKRSERTLQNEVQSSKKPSKLTKQTGTKILVRNIPFQANQKEIRELFTTFGEIKALRLPKKMTLDGGQHRGFCFIDYTSSSEAKAAFEALSQSTHLYGRRLVLEWAQNEEGVEEIRKRTADHFGARTETKMARKSVFNLDE